ncbi:MAG: serine protein kinase PrkA [Planctomycetes bacterium]|nr:serine protein kinase PrkA [Planctomycetota bacterium]
MSEPQAGDLHDGARAVEDVQRRVSERFRDVRRILSFPEYLDLVAADPRRHLRNAAQYLVGMLEYFGRERVERFGEQVDRLRLFDGAFPGGSDFLSGQETVQHEVYRVMKGLAEEGRTDKLILLHGPNGSSKTTVVNLIFRGLEHYSHTDEGALYRFAWIFPKPERTDARLGFGSERRSAREEASFAFLDPADVAARMPGGLQDAPILLLPREERLAWLSSLSALRAAGADPAAPGGEAGLENVLAPYFLEGDLDPKSKAVHEALLTGYQGDFKRVVRHIQVERYFLSRRFRTGAVRVDPQMHVDAGARQLAADRSVEALPPMLQNVALFQPMGDLVDAHRGALEYSDFLKRPIDMNKYLLGTVETGTVSLPGMLLHLDVVLLGTTNENHLDAFKKTLDYNSFKARMELVQVPYLMRVSDEEPIYRDVIRAVARRKTVLPHTARAAALWAVLTRVKKPRPDNYPEDVRALVARLTPLEKVRLYDRGEAPHWMRAEEQPLLRRAVPQMRREFREELLYEGRFGASPREMRAILNEASHLDGFACCGPLAVLEVLGDFVKEKNVYDFLNLEVEGLYHDPAAFIDTVRDEYHRWVTAELEESMALVDTAEYERKCNEYFLHVVAFTRGEKVVQPRTRALEDASEAVMGAVEKMLAIQEPSAVFRRNLVTRIGAFRVEHPDRPLVYKELFPDIYRALQEDALHQRRAQIERLEEQLLLHGTDSAGDIEPRLRERVARTARHMAEHFGYDPQGLKEVVLFVRHHRPRAT